MGDVIYYFGEAQYYYDQFYDPFRAHDRPIFAIPGKHHAVVYGVAATSHAPASLDAFQRNFCAAKPGPAPNAGGLMRGAMTQPGVYFTLDAPMVTIDLGTRQKVKAAAPGKSAQTPKQKTPLMSLISSQFARVPLLRSPTIHDWQS